MKADRLAAALSFVSDSCNLQILASGDRRLKLGNGEDDVVVGDALLRKAAAVRGAGRDASAPAASANAFRKSNSATSASSPIICATAYGPLDEPGARLARGGLKRRQGRRHLAGGCQVAFCCTARRR